MAENIKRKRQTRIIEIIEKEEISTQEDLLHMLSASGFDVTQATVCRDMRELNLIKMQTSTGSIKYVQPPTGNAAVVKKYRTILSETVISCKTAATIVVIKTFAGMAQAAAAAIDHMGWDEIIGCIAGDDTIFLATGSNKDATALCEKLNKTN